MHESPGFKFIDNDNDDDKIDDRKGWNDWNDGKEKLIDITTVIGITQNVEAFFQENCYHIPSKI